MRKKWRLVLVVLLIALPLIPAVPLSAQSELKVHFIDVGQGDSILIDFGETEILIDGGGKSPGVVGYLTGLVDGPLEVMVATHPHADHIGGLIAVLESFQVAEVWHNGDTTGTQTYAEFMTAVQAEGAQVHIGRRQDSFTVGGLALRILNPPSLNDTTNNNSIVLDLSYGQVDFLFMGDAEQEAESSMLAAGLVYDVEVLKIGHHGSRTASSQALLNAVRPEVAIYMAGQGNSYGHPHEETIMALTNVEATVYGTDIHGTVVITTGGEAYSVQAQKQPTPPLISGDANYDGQVNAQDITAVERIIAGLDAQTPGADANQDGNINALDITKVERLIAGLD